MASGGNMPHLARFAVFAVGFGIVVVYAGALVLNQWDWRKVFGDGSLYLAAYGLSVAVLGQLIWKALGYSQPAISQALRLEAGALAVAALLITLVTGFSFAESKPFIDAKPDAQLALGVDDEHPTPSPRLPATKALHQMEVAVRSNDLNAELRAARFLVNAVDKQSTERTWPARENHALFGFIFLGVACFVAGRAEYKLS